MYHAEFDKIITGKSFTFNDGKMIDVKVFHEQITNHPQPVPILKCLTKRQKKAIINYFNIAQSGSLFAAIFECWLNTQKASRPVKA